MSTPKSFRKKFWSVHLFKFYFPTGKRIHIVQPARKVMEKYCSLKYI
jgi:hypothetical protein